MSDEQKTKLELLQELDALRSRVAQLEQAEGKKADEWTSTFDSVTDLVSIQDKDFKFVRVNKAFPDLLKMKTEDIIGKPCYELVHRTKEPPPACPHKLTLDTNKPNTQEFFEPELGVYLEVSASPIFDGEGQITGSVHIAKDITERKRAEEALSRSEKQFRDIFENTAVGMYRTAPDGRIFIANPALVRMLGFSSFEELSQRNLEDEGFEPSYPRSAFRERMEREDQVIGLESQWITRDGTALVVIENARVVRDESGKILYYEGTAEDITQRKRAEETLKESEQKFRTIFENVSDVITYVDTRGTILDTNKRVEDVFGYKPKELVGKNFTKTGLIAPREMPRITDLFRRAVEDDEAMSPFELELNHRDGGKVLVEVGTRIIRKNGKPVGFVSRLTNITERKKAEERLRESEHKFRTVFENAGGAMFIADAETGEILGCNSLAEKLLGRARTEIIGTHQSELHPAGEAEKYKEQFARHTLAGHLADYEGEVLHTDGRKIPVWISAQPMKISGKDLIVGLFIDITERKRAEDALRESEQRFRSLVETTSDWVWEVDQNGVYTYCSPKVKMLLGYEPGEVVGKTPFDLMPEDETARVGAIFRDIVASQNSFEALENTNLHRDGRLVVLETSGVPIFDADGGLVGYRGIDRDITERSKAQDVLDTYREKMARSEHLASIGTVAATVAHELTQPLTVIHLSIENALAKLKATSAPQTVTKNLKDSLAELSNITAIAERFRGFARRSSEQTFRQVDLKAVTQRIVSLLSKNARSARIALRLKGMDELPLVYSNEKDLEQLFFALIDNAIKAADGKKARRIIISGAVEDERVELQFSDNCGGIAPENLGKVFEPFFTTRPPGKGTGLGLCIVQDIVSRTDGRVRVESKFGEGSTFFVSLPISEG